MRLKDKRALVTGASRGIGRAIALAYAREGADVAVTGRTAEALKPVAADMAATGRRVVPVEWDVRQVALAEARLREVAEQLGGLDIIVNNAGVNSRAAFPDVPEDDWDAVLDTNLKAMFFVCQAAAKLWAETGGVIVNITSIAGIDAARNAYGVSKWGANGLTKGLGKMLAPKKIRVNGIAPGPVYTEMMNWRPGDEIEKPGAPIGRWNYPEEIADAAVFLAGDEAKGIAGEVLVVDGAIHLR